MFNAFEPFSFGLIEEFKNRGYRYLVSQCYDTEDAQKLNQKALLLTPYNDPGLAAGHRKALVKDAMASIIDLEKPAHQLKVQEIIEPLSAYKVYVGLVMDKEKTFERLRARYIKNIRRYIANNTAWRIKGDSTFVIDMKIIFGEVHLLMKYNHREELQVRLAEIERS